MPVQNSYPFHEDGYQGRQPTRGGRRGGLGGRAYHRPQEEVFGHEARHEYNLDIANQLELYPYTIYDDMCHLATKIENQRKRIGFSKTNLSSSRNVLPKPQASTYKSWPKKDDIPKVSFKDKDNSKLKVEEKGRLITNLTSFQNTEGASIPIACRGVRRVDTNRGRSVQNSTSTTNNQNIEVFLSNRFF
ncbi:hypothetical protein M9H77_17176 [Catharanthus roseus]|uniref:Uncharacterized protein n=1 Tax=Catharanthus roseus TaxID=4058 RepID=A0ACC0B3V1_CATRO|nr:hypothetical protein M9H77_17176 [Catharanthus roseus]